MKVLFKLFMSLLIIVSLTGCIGENYDFTPPTVTLTEVKSVESVELEEVNINWRGENNEKIEKNTEDIQTFAKGLNQVNFSPGQQVDLLFDSEDFVVKEIIVSVWKNDEKIPLGLNTANGRSFYFPKETGDYVLEIELQTDKGYAQYVGNVTIK